MRSILPRLVAVFSLLLLFVVPTVFARDGAVPVPSGFVAFCKTHASDCKGGGPSVIEMSDNLMALLERINRDTNTLIVPNKHDPSDIWRIGVTEGDCEEYVLAKRRALIRNGVPASALSIVYALRNGGGHAILAVHTDQGSFALDNMTKRIKPLNRTGYRIISMSGPDPLVWHRV